MAGVTVADGGGVVSYLPSCAAVSYGDLNLEDAQSFDITDTDYLVALIPTLVPGLVFGFLSMFGFIFFALWLCTQCCGRRQRQPKGSAEQAQFIGGAQQSAEYAAVPPSKRWLRPSFLLKVLLTAVALAAAGGSAWGLSLSLKATSSTFTSLWDIVEDIDIRVGNATSSLQALDAELTLLNGSVTLLANRTEALSTFAGLIVARLVQQGVWDAAGSGLAQAQQQAVLGFAALAALPGQISGIQEGIQSGVSMLQGNFEETLDDIQGNWEDPTMAIEETWRFVPIAVVFGTTVAISLLCALLFWRLSWYRLATLLTCLLWLDVALLMLLGVALLNGVSVMSNDSCLYSEFMALAIAPGKVKDPTSQKLVMNTLNYYFGVKSIPDDQVVYELMGVPTFRLREVVNDPLLELATNVTGRLSRAEVQAVATSANVPFDALYQILLMLPNISTTLRYLESQALKSSVDPLYHQTKEYLCCTLSRNLGDVFVSWTVAGALGFLLALACSWRLVRVALTMQKVKRRAMAAAAASSVRGEAWEASGYPHQDVNGVSKGGAAEEPAYYSGGMKGGGQGMASSGGASWGTAEGAARPTNGAAEKGLDLPQLPASREASRGREVPGGGLDGDGGFVLRRLQEPGTPPLEHV